jgi:hypothetical protein
MSSVKLWFAVMSGFARRSGESSLAMSTLWMVKTHWRSLTGRSQMSICRATNARVVMRLRAFTETVTQRGVQCGLR